ncbi:MAG: hypothetical protein JW741_06175 [Sedimentisphaerales bacterium]|nr:hypothetical protein [Sedimentisphaerales bacterium]
MAGKVGRSGRKPKWSEEQIEEAAESLHDWLEADPEGHIWFKDWAIENHLPPEYLSRWAAKNPIFRQAMETAEMAQEARLVNGGLRNKLNSRIVALVLESRHRWAGRRSFELTQQDNQPTLQDAVRACMPEDRAEARAWLQGVADGEGIGPEAEAVRTAAQSLLDELRLIDAAELAGSAICDE